MTFRASAGIVLKPPPLAAIGRAARGDDMRTAMLCFLALLGLAAPAWAQTEIVLRADPVPIVEAEINGRPVRLEVDLRLPDVLVLNPSAAERLGVRRIPFVRVSVELDDASIRGRLARPRLVFPEGGTRAFTGVFNVPASRRADGVIGPGALPADVIRIEMKPSEQGEREISFTLADAEVWEPHAIIGGLDMEINFDLANPVSVFNRTASARLDEAGAIVADGALVEGELLLGLRTQMQPVRTALDFADLALGRTVARTRAPLLGALDQDTIVVEGEGRTPPPNLWVGREALASCSSISVDRRTRRLTLSCAG